MKPSTLKKSSIDSIIKLLDDDDETFGILKTQLLNMGLEVFTDIRNACIDPSPKIQERLEQIRLQVNPVENINRLPTLPNGDINLEAGIFYISTICESDLDSAHYIDILDQFAARIAERIHPEQSTKEQIGHINYHLFQECWFKGNREEYYDPDNSLLHRVLDTGMGIPLSLSIFYILLCQRIKLPAEGIGLPEHFMIRIGNDNDTHYVDAFDSGKLQDKNTCLDRLKRGGIDTPDTFLAPVPNSEMLARTCRNLTHAFYLKGIDHYNTALIAMEKFFNNTTRRVS